MKLTTLTCILFLLACCSAWTAETRARLFVAHKGNDTNPGTKAKPFATLERARDEIRKFKQAGLPDGGIAVEIAGGVYELKQPIEFTAEDSGTESAPTEYRARRDQEVRVIGGKTVTGWKPVTDSAVLQRLDPGAHGKVFQADLKSLGITGFQGINSPQSYQSDPGLELFFQGKPMTLARYPKSGYMHIVNALDEKGNPETGIVSTPEGPFVCDDPRPHTLLSRTFHSSFVFQ
ncbi:MAG: hypothetical protein HY318_12140 [Armatimonadetes bacterium]|nr:hypothetical protein [Armatimonadota bacterium]